MGSRKFDGKFERELNKTAGSPAFFAPELCGILENTPYLSTVGSSNSSLENGTNISFVTADKDEVVVKRRKADRLMLDHVRAVVPIGAGIDVWAIGVTLFCVCFGKVPFLGGSEFELFHVITKQKVFIPGGNDLLKALLEGMMDKDPSRRLGIEGIRFHSWTTQDIDAEDRMTWLNETDVGHVFNQPTVVSDEEVEDAMTLMEKIQKGIRKISTSLGAIVRKNSSGSSLVRGDEEKEVGAEWTRWTPVNIEESEFEDEEDGGLEFS